MVQWDATCHDATGLYQSTATSRGLCGSTAEGSGRCLFPELGISSMEVFTEPNSKLVWKSAETVGFHFTFCLHNFLLNVSCTLPVKILTCAWA